MLIGSVIYAKNLEILTKFYSVLGGLPVEEHKGEFAVLAYEETELTLVQAPDQITSQIVIETPPIARSGNPVKPAFKVTSIEETLAALCECGGTILPNARQWTFRNSLVQDMVDPEGNIIQLRQPV